MNLALSQKTEVDLSLVEVLLKTVNLTHFHCACGLLLSLAYVPANDRNAVTVANIIIEKMTVATVTSTSVIPR